MLILIIIFNGEVEGKYIYQTSKSIFKIENADSEFPVINGRNYSVQDEVFNDNVKVEFLDNIGIKYARYAYNESENIFAEEAFADFTSGTVFENSGYYKIIVSDLYNNINEYTFMIDKQVDNSEVVIKTVEDLQTTVEIVAEDKLSGIQKLEVYVDGNLFKTSDYTNENMKKITEELVFEKEEINFYEEVYLLVYDELNNIKKSESIILNVDKIYNIVDLYRFRDVVNNKICDFEDKTVYLMNSLTLELETLNDWVPISEFKGFFDGQKHTIYGFYMDKDIEKTAFFAENYGTIQDLTIIGEIHTTKDITGGICAENFGTIIWCRSKVRIYSEGSYIGGITGINHGLVTYSRNNNHTNTTGSYVGGIVGYNKKSGQIIKCGSSGIMVGDKYIGGICGFVEGGSKKTNIELSYNMLHITGTEYVGGICGGTDNANVTLKYLYNRGDITETSNKGHNGGIIGNGKSTVVIRNGYNIGEIVSDIPNTIAPQNTKWDTMYYISGKTNTSRIGWAKDKYLFRELTDNEESVLYLLSKNISDTWTIVYGENDYYPMFQWQFE